MRKGLIYIVLGLISVGIIALSTVDSVKYLTCEEPDKILVEITSISDTEITLVITKDTNSESFSSFVYHIEDNILYVGAKYTMNPLNNEPTAVYTETLELTAPLESVIVKGGMIEEQIYPE